MRTTIELTQEQRAELIRLASKRGMKGFSRIIQEALGDYLRQESKKLQLIESALSLQGTLRGKAGDEFEERARALRGSWR